MLSSATRRLLRVSSTQKHRLASSSYVSTNALRFRSTAPATTSAWSEVQVEARGLDFQVTIQNDNSSSSEPVLCLPGALGTGPADFCDLLEGGLGPDYQVVVAFDPRAVGGSASSCERDSPLAFISKTP